MEKAGGYFQLIGKNGEVELELKNGLTVYGGTQLLQAYFQKTAPGVSDIYIGLTNESYTFDGTTLASLAAGEPAGNGYARQDFPLSNVGWGINKVNGVLQCLSKLATFTASANWTSLWQRMFLCDAAAGTAGNVIAVSGPAPNLIQTLSGAGPSMKYIHYLRG